MIRQHFYPKTYIRHRSSSNSNHKAISFIHESSQTLYHKEIQGKDIRRYDNRKILQDKNQLVGYFIEGVVTETEQKKQITREFQKISQRCLFQQLSENQNHRVLKQINNRASRQIQQKLSKQYDLRNLFIKSDKKQIVKAHRSSYRVLGSSNAENQSFYIENTNDKKTKKYATSRKLSSADGAKNSFRRSQQKKKKMAATPSQMVIGSNLQTLQKMWNLQRKVVIQQKKQTEFERVTENLINLNLSKAIKFRQSSRHDKIHKSRKMSQKINVADIQNRNYELQQKVKGWQIQIEDDVEFQS